MRAFYPVEIVGGGLAGLALGLGLRRAGVPVCIQEAGHYPRHRVCGEFIAGLDDATREHLQLDTALAGSILHRDVAWFRGPRLLQIQKLPAPAFGLSRHTLDQRLAAAFVTAGGDLRTGHRQPVEPATGRVLTVGRAPARGPWMGLKGHFRGFALERGLELHLGDQAYVGLAAVEEGWINVCGYFRRRQLQAPAAALLLAYLEASGLGALAQRLGTAETDPAAFCAVAGLGMDRGVPYRTGLRLGDACAVIPPFTGNGMAMAFQSAALALPALVDYAQGRQPWGPTVAACHRRLRRRFRVRLAAASVLHPWLLQLGRQRWLAAASRSRLLPLRPLYAVLH